MLFSGVVDKTAETALFPPLTEEFESDLVTEPRGYVAGEYVLFYTPEVLDGTEKRDAWVHHLYLLEDGQVKRIAGYTQDYPYV